MGTVARFVFRRLEFMELPTFLTRDVARYRAILMRDKAALQVARRD